MSLHERSSELQNNPFIIYQEIPGAYAHVALIISGVSAKTRLSLKQEGNTVVVSQGPNAISAANSFLRDMVVHKDLRAASKHTQALTPNTHVTAVQFAQDIITVVNPEHPKQEVHEMPWGDITTYVLFPTFTGKELEQRGRENLSEKIATELKNTPYRSIQDDAQTIQRILGTIAPGIPVGVLLIERSSNQTPSVHADGADHQLAQLELVIDEQGDQMRAAELMAQLTNTTEAEGLHLPQEVGQKTETTKKPKNPNSLFPSREEIRDIMRDGSRRGMLAKFLAHAKEFLSDPKKTMPIVSFLGATGGVATTWTGIAAAGSSLALLPYLGFAVLYFGVAFLAEAARRGKSAHRQNKNKLQRSTTVHL